MPRKHTLFPKVSVRPAGFRIQKLWLQFLTTGGKNWRTGPVMVIIRVIFRKIRVIP